MEVIRTDLNDLEFSLLALIHYKRELRTYFQFMSEEEQDDTERSLFSKGLVAHDPYPGPPTFQTTELGSELVIANPLRTIPTVLGAREDGLFTVECARQIVRRLSVGELPALLVHRVEGVRRLAKNHLDEYIPPKSRYDVIDIK